MDMQHGELVKLGRCIRMDGRAGSSEKLTIRLSKDSRAWADP